MGYQAVLAHTVLLRCNIAAEMHTSATQVLPCTILIALHGTQGARCACRVLLQPDFSVQLRHWSVGSVRCYSLLDFETLILFALGGKPICAAELHGRSTRGSQAGQMQCQEIVEVKQDLAAAKEARKEGERETLLDLLLSLNNQLSGLQEKEKILLRGQALDNHCFQLVHARLLVFSSCHTPVPE